MAHSEGFSTLTPPNCCVFAKCDQWSSASELNWIDWAQKNGILFTASNLNDIFPCSFQHLSSFRVTDIFLKLEPENQFHFFYQYVMSGWQVCTYLVDMLQYE